MSACLLAKVAETHASRQKWPHLDLEAALDIGRSWPSVEEYLARLRPPITQKRQWGGFVEAALISHDWKITVAIFAKRSDGKYFLLCEPVKPPGVSPEHRICVVWKDTHYDLAGFPRSVGKSLPARAARRAILTKISQAIGLLACSAAWLQMLAASAARY